MYISHSAPRALSSESSNQSSAAEMLCDLEGVTHSLWSSVFSPLIYAGCLKRGLGALPAPKPVTSKLTVFCLTSQALQVILCLEHLFSPTGSKHLSKFSTAHFPWEALLILFQPGWIWTFHLWALVAPLVAVELEGVSSV